MTSAPQRTSPENLAEDLAVYPKKLGKRDLNKNLNLLKKSLFFMAKLQNI